MNDSGIATAHAKHILATLEQFQTADVHTKYEYIAAISGALTSIEEGDRVKWDLDWLVYYVECAKKWLAQRTDK
jgi:hypothetical protein